MSSGFEQTEGRPNPPMRVSRILDAITIHKQAGNYIAIIDEVTGLVKKQTKFINIYHINDLVIETLLYIDALNNFKDIHETTVYYINDKKNRDCDCLML